MRRRQASIQRLVEIANYMSDAKLNEAVSAIEQYVGPLPSPGGFDTQGSAVGAHGVITLGNIEDVMTYQPWDRQQQASGDIVREAITMAAKAILREVHGSPRRTMAIQHLISARMDANAAISFRGRF